MYDKGISTAVIKRLPRYYRYLGELLEKDVVRISSKNLEISSLFKQDNVKVKDIEAPITVVDISRGGIGFHSVSRLPIGYSAKCIKTLSYYNRKRREINSAVQNMPNCIF